MTREELKNIFDGEGTAEEKIKAIMGLYGKSAEASNGVKAELDTANTTIKSYKALFLFSVKITKH